jgi:tRNA (cmo5U34)-methyltransferase
MERSVLDHLVVEPKAYDVQIRRFVPGYEAMHDEIIDALTEHLRPASAAGGGRVLDLGAGTGALSERILDRFQETRLQLLDSDPKMLEQARIRLARLEDRIEVIEGSFCDPLPKADAVVAALALHHLHTRKVKRQVYRNILGILPPGGVLVSGDAMMPSVPALAEPVRRRWAAHLVAHGDSEEQAFDRFAQWSTEDRYFSIDQEIEMLREAGFEEVDVRWRVGPIAVLVARAQGADRRRST